MCAGTMYTDFVRMDGVVCGSAPSPGAVPLLDRLGSGFTGSLTDSSFHADTNSE